MPKFKRVGYGVIRSPFYNMTLHFFGYHNTQKLEEKILSFHLRLSLSFPTMGVFYFRNPRSSTGLVASVQKIYSNKTFTKIRIKQPIKHLFEGNFLFNFTKTKTNGFCLHANDQKHEIGPIYKLLKNFL